jgi:hypothetical protein
MCVVARHVELCSVRTNGLNVQVLDGSGLIRDPETSIGVVRGVADLASILNANLRVKHIHLGRGVGQIL